MPRFAGIQDNRIIIVSDTSFACEGVQVIELPSYLSDTPVDELILNYKVKDKQIVNIKEKKLAKDMKIALVGNWKMKCGIATYAENLWPNIVPYFNDFKIFAEYDNFATGPLNEMNGINFSVDKISVCWKRGESLQELTSQIKEYNPDIVLINHEFGLWSNAMYWLSLMTQLSNFRVIVVMHSVFHHKDKTICEAAMPEIITHLEGGKNLLQHEKGITSKIHVIPHGCYQLDNNRLWNFYKSEHTIIQAGFLFRYKGWQESLKAVAILKAKYSDVFFTGICSESEYCKLDHQMYYDELKKLISELGIEENVSLIRGYQSDTVLDSYFKTNKIALFPYISHPEHEVFGASGAARLAMSKGLPVITSSINHFTDLCTIKTNTPEEMAFEIDKLFADPKLQQEQINKQIKYITENSWENIAKMYLKIFEN